MRVRHVAVGMNRCPDKKTERGRNWRCERWAGHPGVHVNYYGHKHWGGEVTEFIDRRHARPMQSRAARR